MLPNKLLLILIFALIFVNFYGFTCGASPIILKKKRIYETQCKNNELSVYYDIWGRSPKQFAVDMFLDKKGIFWINENAKIYLDENSDYLDLDNYTGEDAIQIKFYCKDNNKKILDTGRIPLEKVGCQENHTWFYFLDGHAKKKEGESCFPDGANIEGLKKYMK